MLGGNACGRGDDQSAISASLRGRKFACLYTSYSAIVTIAAATGQRQSFNATQANVSPR
jgi:hypothetical protein